MTAPLSQVGDDCEVDDARHPATASDGAIGEDGLGLTTDPHRSVEVADGVLVEEVLTLNDAVHQSLKRCLIGHHQLHAAKRRS